MSLRDERETCENEERKRLVSSSFNDYTHRFLSKKRCNDCGFVYKYVKRD